MQHGHLSIRTGALSPRTGALVGLAFPLLAAPGPVAIPFLVVAILLLVLLALHRTPSMVSENGALILTLDDVRVRLARFLGRPVMTALADDTPIVIAPGSDPRDPWELEAALVRNGLGLRARRRGVLILPRTTACQMADLFPEANRTRGLEQDPGRERILEIAASDEPPALRLARVQAYTGDLDLARDFLRDAQDRLRHAARTGLSSGTGLTGQGR